MLAGDPSGEEIWGFVRDESRRCGQTRQLKLIPPNSHWEQAISRRLRELVVPGRRILMVLSPPDGHQPEHEHPSGDVNVLDMTGVDPDDLSPRLVIGIRRNWGTVETFQAAGVGFQIVQSKEPVSICFAVAVGEGAAPIQINTAEGHRRQGFARRCAEAFIRRCGERGLAAHWDCDEANGASHDLALRLGFTEQLRYTMYLCRRLERHRIRNPYGRLPRPGPFLLGQ